MYHSIHYHHIPNFKNFTPFSHACIIGPLMAFLLNVPQYYTLHLIICHYQLSCNHCHGVSVKGGDGNPSFGIIKQYSPDICYNKSVSCPLLFKGKLC